jgi:7-cyano-7-deazaguanine synthase in queuosine biosynthesis
MNHPLIDSCLEISRAGYEKRSPTDMPWDNARLLSLGNYLLNNSGLDTTFRLQSLPSGTEDIAICFGGGIDSYCALVYAIWQGRRVHLIHVDYGSPYCKHERAVFGQIEDIYRQEGVNPFAADFARDEHGDISFHREEIQLVTPSDAGGLDWSNYIVPARNLVLAAIGSKYASTVWIVSTKRSDETVGTPDKTSRFYQSATQIFTAFYNRRILVTSPFRSYSKLEVVQRYIDGGGSTEALKATFSCYSPKEKGTPCGTCYACYKRFKLFQHLNIEVSFATHPQEGPNFGTYRQQEESKRGGSQ